MNLETIKREDRRRSNGLLFWARQPAPSAMRGIALPRLMPPLMPWMNWGLWSANRSIDRLILHGAGAP